MRSICNPKDIFNLMEIAINDKWNNLASYIELRNIAQKEIRRNYSLDELFEQIKVKSRISDDLVEDIKVRHQDL